MNIYIKPVEYCNLKCMHCYNSQKSDSIDYDNLERFLTGINVHINDSYFILHGGEPLLAPPIKILNLIKKFPQNKWRITTNLCMDITEERLSILKLMGEVRTSFDIGIRFGNMKNLLKWISNIKKLQSMNINIYLNICLSDMIIKKDPYKLLKMLKHLGIKILAFERITDVGNAANHEYIIPKYEDVDTWLCKLYNASKKFPNIKIRAFEEVLFGLLKDEKNCRSQSCCKNTMTINSDGTIGTCPNDAQINTIGNLNSDISLLLRLKGNSSCHIKKECLACEKYDKCFGGCAQLEWQGDVCPYPHKLSKLIEGDM